jgi:hypothetical protein
MMKLTNHTKPDTLRSLKRYLSITSICLLAFNANVGLAAKPGSGGQPSVVEISGVQGDWQMLVDGVPYTVKGVCWGPDVSSATVDGYMADLAAMGVNTIRTWGTGSETATLLDAAERHGVKVMLGHWLMHHVDYADDAPYKSRAIREIKRRVNEYKDHPALLSWNVGNEVILFLQDTFSGQELEDNRVAYGQFIGDLVNEIHAIDPNHPVTTTVAYTDAWSYLKTGAPNLDFYSVNSYGAIGTVSDGWAAGGYTKPYTVTEYGAEGEWEVPDDVNGVPTEPTDLEKREDYTFAWNEIIGHTGVGLGGFAFIYGHHEDFAGIWLNLKHPGDLRRLTYYAVKDAYTDAPLTDNLPPEVNTMTISPASNVPAGSTVTVSIDVNDPENDALSYTLKQGSKYIDGSNDISSANFVQVSDGVFDLTAPNTAGVWKIYVYVYDGQDNVGIETRSLQVDP